MKWGYVFAVCFLLLVTAVFRNVPFRALLSGIGLAVATKLGGSALVTWIARQANPEQRNIWEKR